MSALTWLCVFLSVEMLNVQGKKDEIRAIADDPVASVVIALEKQFHEYIDANDKAGLISLYADDAIVAADGFALVEGIEEVSKTLTGLSRSQLSGIRIRMSYHWGPARSTCWKCTPPTLVLKMVPRTRKKMADEIIQYEDEYHAYLDARNTDGLLSMYAEDAIVAPDGYAVQEGTEEVSEYLDWIRESVQTRLPETHIIPLGASKEYVLGIHPSNVSYPGDNSSKKIKVAAIWKKVGCEYKIFFCMINDGY